MRLAKRRNPPVCPGLVAGLDIGQRRDSCALVAAGQVCGDIRGSTEQAWRVVDARNAPLGTGSAATAPMLRDRLAAFGSDKVRLVVDATGAGDAWLDHMVAVGVVPTPAAVVVGSLVSRNVGRSAGFARSISPE
jgi:hypothetical protein